MAGKNKGHLGMPGYARALGRMPCSAVELVDSGVMSHTAAWRFLQVCHRAGWAHIVDWRMGFRAKPIAVYAFGRGLSVPAPTMRPNGKPVRGTIKPPVWAGPTPPGLLAFFSVLDALVDGATALEVVAECGLGEWSVRGAIRALKQQKLVRIAAYAQRRNGSLPGVPVYQLGQGRDADRPRRKSRKAINADYRAKLAWREAFAPIP